MDKLKKNYYKDGNCTAPCVTDCKFGNLKVFWEEYCDHGSEDMKCYSEDAKRDHEKKTMRPSDWNTGEKTSWPAPEPVKVESNETKTVRVTDWNTGKMTDWTVNN